MSNVPYLDKYDVVQLWAAFWDASVTDMFLAYNTFNFGEIREEFFCQTWSWPPVINYPGDTFLGV